jgi:selenocysteine lyase/cysteine desulfurase
MHARHDAFALPPVGEALSEAFLLAPERLYLDCAAHAPRLHAVQRAAEAMLAEEARRPWTQDWDALIVLIERVRSGASRLFDGDAEGVALVPSVAYALSVAALNVPLHAEEAVLVLAGQFPSNVLPWQQRCADVGAHLHVVADPEGDWTPAVLDALHAHPEIRGLALPQAYWRDGRLLDLDRIADAAHVAGAWLVLDLSQSLGALPADLGRWRPAFVASAGYKWLLGADGLAYLWASAEWRDRGLSLEHSWFNRRARDDWRFPLDRPADFLAGARRFDGTGLIDRVRLAKADAAFSQLAAWEPKALTLQLGLRTAALREALQARGVPIEIVDPGAPHIAALRPGTAWTACVRALDEACIDVTARHGVLRIAPYLHVGLEDVRRVADVLARALS